MFHFYQLQSVTISYNQLQSINYRLYFIYNKTLSDLVNKHAPLQQVCTPRRPATPWFSNDIREEIRKRRTFESIWRKVSQSDENRKKFTTQRNLVKSLVISAKKRYFNDIVQFHKNSPRQLWSSINSLLQKNKSIILPSFNDPVDCANKFVKFFSDKISLIHQNLAPSCAEQNAIYNGPTLSEFNAVMPDEANAILANMKPKTSYLDPIPTHILKSCSNIAIPLLCYIANKSLSSGSLPISEKRAAITPLIKKKSLNKENLQNYRPVSGLTFLSKFIERTVYKRLVDHLNTQSLFSPFQSAYRPYHSTETALFKLHNDITANINDGLLTCIIFLDLSAAFDTVDHAILLERLHDTFGLRGTVLKWFSSYLQDRNQIVRVSHSSSNSYPISCGVPQGSVLGPCLYSCYTFPITQIITSYGLSVQIYADDTTIYISFKKNSHETAFNSLQRCIIHLFNWFNTNKLKLNPQKTEVAIFGSATTLKSSTVSDFVVYDNIVKISSDVKCLGIFFDQQLRFDRHISSITQSSFLFIKSLYRIRDCLDDDTIAKIIQACIFSRLDYCNGILNKCGMVRLQRLQRIQNSCARLIKRLPRHSDTSLVRKDLHWLPIKFRISYKICCFAHKRIYGVLPDYLMTLLSIRTPPADSVRLRSYCAPTLIQPVAKSTISSSGFKFSAPFHWNALPASIRSLDNYNTFRKQLKTHFFTLAFN